VITVDKVDQSSIAVGSTLLPAAPQRRRRPPRSWPARSLQQFISRCPYVDCAWESFEEFCEQPPQQCPSASVRMSRPRLVLPFIF